jgi:phosphoglycerate dehydrogenase-like enzyme
VPHTRVRPFPHPDFTGIGGSYVDLRRCSPESDIVSLHCPLTPESHHLINAQTLSQMKTGVMLINTSRGGLIDAPAVIDALKAGKVAYLGLDVYEQEADFFYEDLSGTIIHDDVLQRLLTFPNVVITSHQAVFHGYRAAQYRGDDAAEHQRLRCRAGSETRCRRSSTQEGSSAQRQFCGFLLPEQSARSERHEQIHHRIHRHFLPRAHDRMHGDRCARQE